MQNNEVAKTEEEGVSLSQIFKVAFHNKIRLLIVSAVVFLVIVLVMIFGYNRSKKTYVANFVYSDVNVTNGKYSDGSNFIYKDLIKIDLLTEMVEKHPEYKNILIEDIVDKGDISIERIKEVEEITEEEYRYTEYFKLSIKASYFENEKQAKAFICDFINYPIEKSNSLIDSIIWDESLKLFDQANIYGNQISYLVSQKDMMINGYNSLISTYGDVMINGTHLSSNINDINLYFTNNRLGDLSQQVEFKGFVKDESYKATIALQIDALEREQVVNTEKVNQLQEQVENLLANAGNLQTLDLSKYNEDIIELTKRNADIKKELKILNQYLGVWEEGSVPGTEEEKQKLEADLVVFKNKLKEYTEAYSKNYKYCTETYSKVYYNESNSVVAEGDLSIIIILVAGIFVGALVGLAANLCFDYKMLNNKKEQENQAN